jgi:2-succinyl-5-enolpyruvyl-6-hydroxy-3-cyclohexene-1-carboxylate synthase
MATVDSDRAADQKFLALPDLQVPAADSDWIATWSKLAERSAKVIADLDIWSEELFAREFARHIPSGAALFIASSRPIRDIEGFAIPRSGVSVYANRGLAGIDGNISTALGIASGANHTYAVIGDLAFLHDVSALSHSSEAKLRLFVIDNNGGGIFSTLPQAGVEGFETIFGTPHDRDIAAIATSFGVKTTTISSVKELSESFTKPVTGFEIVVVKVPTREKNAELLKAIYTKMESL